eukprot:9956-Heterococcus_DN1.PRE.1
MSPRGVAVYLHTTVFICCCSTCQCLHTARVYVYCTCLEQNKTAYKNANSKQAQSAQVNTNVSCPFSSREVTALILRNCKRGHL